MRAIEERAKPGKPLWAATAAVALSACDTAQSALDPKGRDAETIADLFWLMLGGAAVVWLVVMAVAVYAIQAKEGLSRKAANRFITIGGVAFPTVVITALLVRGLSVYPSLLEPSDPGAPEIRISGEQWWWRIEYRTEDGIEVEAANELRLPRGVRVSVEVVSPDVIHSLWIPALGGKVDAIPGRVNHLGLEPTSVGDFRGFCAEYCGLSHTEMMLDVVVMEPDAFESWLRSEAQPAPPPQGGTTERGQDVFLKQGCGACHRVRDSPAQGGVGPELTHLASRKRIAGILPTDDVNLRHWLEGPAHHKPGAHMPAYAQLSPEDMKDLTRYLLSLQ